MKQTCYNDPKRPCSYLFPILILFGCLHACTGNKQAEATDAISSPGPVVATTGHLPQALKTDILRKGDFPVELLANGKLTAPRKANLKFRSDGIITQLAIREGMRVQSGQLLAALDTTQLAISMAQSRLGLRRALLDYEDHLLRAGYQIADTGQLAPAVKNIVRLRSGLSAAEIESRQRANDLENTWLKAPFPGKIANVKAREQNFSSAFEYICTLVDDQELIVDFQVLEQELPFIRASRTVRVIPFSGNNQVYTGTITSINPLIDEAGMVSVKALIRNRDGQLLDGMNVRILVRQVIAGQLVVPKEAVLDRQGRKVVFTRQDTLSKWNYVDILHENSTSYAIRGETLKAGDEVIVEGNFNLAHDKPLSTP